MVWKPTLQRWPKYRWETTLMENLIVEVRFQEDETRLSPGRLTGTLLTYERRASDRQELFKRGSLYWPENGITINDQHNRKETIVRAVPFLDGDAIKIDVELPDTTRGRDCATNVRAGILPGLSIEFHAEKEARRGGLREIRRARLARAGLVDTPSYADSKVEVRNQDWCMQDEEALRWL